ncbi:MAG TPA: hypothetical protein VMW91_09720 [Desulfosporosinus sp.]|nr:hypothetical protein [Desulfosporosinus sp.]
MKNKLKRAVNQLHIDMSSEDKTIKIKNDTGQDIELDNILIIGGNSKTKGLYIFAEGQPKDVGETFAGVFKWSRMDKTDQQSFLRRVFAYFLRRICEQLGIPIEEYPRDMQLISIKTHEEAEMLLSKWEEEDEEKKKDKKEDTKWN